jgi:hypothetical protein
MSVNVTLVWADGSWKNELLSVVQMFEHIPRRGDIVVFAHKKDWLSGQIVEVTHYSMDVPAEMSTRAALDYIEPYERESK